MQETWVQSLGREDPLEKEMATHSSTLAWKIPWTDEPSRLHSMGSQRVGHNSATSLHFTTEKTQFWYLAANLTVFCYLAQIVKPYQIFNSSCFYQYLIIIF